MQRNKWDVLAEKFDTQKKSQEIDPDAADNVLIAWPAMLSMMRQHFPHFRNKTALDFGCGTGGFAQKLHLLGFATTGVDISEAMLNIAQKSIEGVRFATPDQVRERAAFDLISSIMVFQFIEDIEMLLSDLVGQLRSGGLLVFAVFNPEFVSECLRADTVFSDFDSVENPHKGLIDLGAESKIPTFIRTADQYDRMLIEKGLQKKLELRPGFTPEFLAAYPTDMPTDVPEYLVLGYSLD